ncbi:hypothetical protein BGC07_18680 [Piscirickettsia litoralis]|uniref:Uncharacterized protein n=2 Tax=Piscirickettsia litoralis TaxID=1891921 RepID=A0ABX2ZXR1_9GAMM|nr:hypothetical protein BGC07_18680 [Piscirickettsia litoralis]
MTPTEEEKFWLEFEKALDSDDGAEAKRHLAEGRSIYYGDDRYPNAVIKEHPDGPKQLVTFDRDNDYTEVVLQELS